MRGESIVNESRYPGKDVCISFLVDDSDALVHTNVWNLCGRIVIVCNSKVFQELDAYETNSQVEL